MLRGAVRIAVLASSLSMKGISFGAYARNCLMLKVLCVVDASAAIKRDVIFSDCSGECLIVTYRIMCVANRLAQPVPSVRYAGHSSEIIVVSGLMRRLIGSYGVFFVPHFIETQMQNPPRHLPPKNHSVPPLFNLPRWCFCFAMHVSSISTYFPGPPNFRWLSQ